MSNELLKQIAIINEQEKRDNDSFKKWLGHFELSDSKAVSLEQFVEQLNREIADLKSEIVHLKINRN